MFCSSFGSCRSKAIPDVVEQSFFFPQNPQHHHLLDLFFTKPQPFPSICRPKWKEMVEEKDKGCLRTRISKGNSPISDGNNQKCSQTSPIDVYKPNVTESKSKKVNRKKKRMHSCKFSSSVEASYYGLHISDDNEYIKDETTLFSSKSMSSDSSGSFRRRTSRRRLKSGKTRVRTVEKKEIEEEDLMALEGEVGDSFAVVKRSSDPYNDFRTSMVEMIVERQIYGGKDLEELLRCFLCLNLKCHHKVIVQVFTEIWETLFCTSEF